MHCIYFFFSELGWLREAHYLCGGGQAVGLHIAALLFILIDLAAESHG